MAESRPLRLHRQKAASPVRARKFERVADVLVDTPVFHLSEPFTYGVPNELTESISIGSIVKVPFKDGDVDGVVVALRADGSASFKPILKLLPVAPIPIDVWRSVTEIAKRYVRRPIDFLRFIPELPTGSKIGSEPLTRKPIRTLQLTEKDGTARSVELALEGKGRRLLIFPSEREARYAQVLFSQVGISAPYYQASARITERRKVLNTLGATPESIILGTRSSILLPLPLDTVVVKDEISPHYWEERSPYWNVRDLALIRSGIEKFDLHFVSAAPSLEIERLVRTGYLVSSREKSAVRVNRKFDFSPDTYHRTIREALPHGPVLVSVIDKTYSNIFNCDRCKSLPLCACGGRFRLASSTAVRCGLCAKEINEWRCSECGSDRKYLVRRGASRVVEELGRAFPRTKISNLSANSQSSDFLDPAILVSTPGLEPLGVEFAGVVLLDGDAALQRHGLRSEEILRERWFRALNLASPTARIYLSLPRAHRLSQSLLAGNPRRAIDAELAERESVDLPPARRLLQIAGPESDLLTLSEELGREHRDLIISGASSGEIVLRAKVEKTTQILSTLFALQRYRSAARRPLLDIRVDPFDI